MALSKHPITHSFGKPRYVFHGEVIDNLDKTINLIITSKMYKDHVKRLKMTIAPSDGHRRGFEDRLNKSETVEVLLVRRESSAIRSARHRCKKKLMEVK